MIQLEVVNGIELMKADGFNPTAFAFPYGKNNGIINDALKPYFKTIRALNGTKDYAKSVVKTTNNYLLFAFGLDKSSGHTNTEIEKLLEGCKENGDCAIFVGHDIGTTDKFSTTRERLIAIGTQVKTLQLRCYLARELAN